MNQPIDQPPDAPATHGEVLVPVPVLSGERERLLIEVLTDAQRLGFLGRGPVQRHISHGVGFAAAWAEVEPAMAPGQPRSPRRIGDLGSGGGVPGLVLAMAIDAHLVLVDNKTKRTDWLTEAAARLGADDRISVVAHPAEEAGHQPEWRGTCDVVVARSFAGPAPTAESAAGLVRRGGLVVVSEPPETTDRWSGLLGTPLGYAAVRPITRPEGHYAVLVAGTEPLEDRFPRTWAAQKKRPMFDSVGRT